MSNLLASRSSIPGNRDDDETAAVGDHDPLKRSSFDHNHLILRSERSERLEGWQQAQCGFPPFETQPYGLLLRVRWCGSTLFRLVPCVLQQPGVCLDFGLDERREVGRAARRRYDAERAGLGDEALVLADLGHRHREAVD